MSRRKQSNPKSFKVDEDGVGQATGEKGSNSKQISMKAETFSEVNESFSTDFDDEERPLVIDTSCDLGRDQVQGQTSNIDDNDNNIECNNSIINSAPKNSDKNAVNNIEVNRASPINNSITAEAKEPEDMAVLLGNYQSASISSKFNDSFPKVDPYTIGAGTGSSGQSTPLSYHANGVSVSLRASPDSPHSSAGSGPPSPHRPIPGRRSKKQPMQTTIPISMSNPDKKFTCPVCPEVLANSHDLTKHIRSHNTIVTGSTSNNQCTICGKVLSSQSSLDRHMLVHSGERPFKCKVCKMAFTTNGNMHRHMRIHGKDGEGSVDDVRPGPGRKSRLNKTFASRRDLSVPSMVGFHPIHVPSMNNSFHDFSFADRKLLPLPIHGEKRLHEDNMDEELHAPKRRMPPSVESGNNSPSSRDSMEDPMGQEDSVGFDIDNQIDGSQDSDTLQCPMCSKSFLCKQGLATHLEAHAGSGWRCLECSLLFRTQRGLQMHKLVVHSEREEEKSEVAGSDDKDDDDDDDDTDLETNGEDHQEGERAGFQDLAFMEFSNNKFILAAKAFCEKNPRTATSSYHEFSCKTCGKSFPCKSALKLHECAHIPEKLSSCPLCKCHFDDAQKLHVHMIKHLSDKALEDCQGQFDLTNCKGQDGFMKHNFLAYFDLKSTDDFADQGESISALTAVEKRQNNDYFAKLGQAYSAKLALQKSASQAIKCELESRKENQMPLEKSRSLSSLPSASGLSSMAEIIKASASGSGINKNGFNLPENSMNMLESFDIAGPISTSSPNSGSSVSTNAALSRMLPVGIQSMMHAASLSAQQFSPSVTSRSPLTDEDSGSGMGDFPLHERSSAKGMFFCKYCDKGFSNSRALKGHTRTHLGLSPYKCNLCPYSSADKSTLIRHLRTHNGERPFQCLICEFAFTTKANCERHVRKKHDKLSKEDIEKSIGYNKFVSADSAKKLDATNFHSPDTVCKYCGVDFKFFRALKHHLRSHSSCRQKPFRCQKCNIGFSTKANCVRHIQKQHLDVPQNLIESFIEVNEPAVYSMSMEKDMDLSDASVEMSFNSACSSPNLSILRFQETLISAQNGVATPCPRPAHSTPVRTGFSMVEQIKKETGETIITDEMPLDFSMKAEQNPTPPPSHKPILQPKIAAADNPGELPIDLSVNKEAGDTEKHNHQLSSVKPPSISALPSHQIRCQYCPMGFPSRGALDRHQRLKHHIPLGFTSRPNRSAHARSASLTRSAFSATALNTSSGSDCDLASIHKMMDIINPHKFQAFFQSPETEQSPPYPIPSRAHENKPATMIVPRPEILKHSALEIESETNFDDKLSPSESLDENFNRKPSDMDSALYEGETTPTGRKQFAFDEDYSHYNYDNDMDSNHEMKDEPNDSSMMDNSMEGQKSDGDGSQQKKKRNSYADSPHKLQCPYCPRTFPWISSLTRHLLTHTGQKPYKCPRCPVTFSTKSNRERHLIRKHNVNMLDPASRQTMDRPFKCHLCIFSSFSTKSNLLKHYEERHPGSIIPEAILKGEYNPDLNDLEGGDYDEGQLMESYDMASDPEIEDSPKMHMEEDEIAKVDFVMSDEPRKMPAPMSNRPLNPERDNYNVDKITECWKCRAKFLSRKLLVRHLKEHNIDYPYKCYLCDASFQSRKECLCHQENMHLEDWPHLQEKNKVDNIETFSNAMEELVAKNYKGSEIDITDPTKIVAGEESQIDAATSDYIQRKVYCSLCPKRFWSLQDLRRHMRSHTGEKPFECDLCQKRFTLKHSMMRHRRKHLEMPDSMSASDDEESNNSEDIGSKSSERKNLVIESVLNRIRANQEHSGTMHKLSDVRCNDDALQKKKLSYLQARRSPVTGISGSSSRDILQSLLGVEDAAIDEMLESAADSAAERLGVK